MIEDFLFSNGKIFGIKIFYRWRTKKSSIMNQPTVPNLFHLILILFAVWFIELYSVTRRTNDGEDRHPELSTRVKEHKGAVRRQDENSLLALHCLTTGHAFDWDRASIIGKGTTKHTHDCIEAWNTTSTCVNQNITLDPDNRALRD